MPRAVPNNLCSPVYLLCFPCGRVPPVSSVFPLWPCFPPCTLLRDVKDFSNGTLRVQFKTISGTSDRCSGIVFNVKPNGDWLAIRYNDTEQNVALWEFHNGIRRMVNAERKAPGRSTRRRGTSWRSRSMASSSKPTMDGKPPLEYTLGSEPVAGRRGPPHPDLYPANNPVLRPPVAGRVGLWSKTDSTSYLKGFVVEGTGRTGM